jgi:hypothetical protein
MHYAIAAATSLSVAFIGAEHATGPAGFILTVASVFATAWILTGPDAAAFYRGDK